MEKTNFTPSPVKQYEELNFSLAAQVQDTSRNLLGGSRDQGSMQPPFTIDEIEDNDALVAEARDVVPKTNLTEVGSECIQVYLKIRPFNDEEICRRENKDCFEVKPPTIVVAHPPPESNTFKNQIQLNGACGAAADHQFSFTRVFSDNTSQKQFFDETTQPYVRNLINGQDGLLFSYGVTNGGKTFTFLGTDAEPGLVPRFLGTLFQNLKDKLIEEPDIMPRMFNYYEMVNAKKRQEMTAAKIALWKFLDTGEFKSLCNNATASTTFLTAADSSAGSSQSSWESVDDGVNRLQEQSMNNLSTALDFRCSVWVSFYEIYNEQVYDLLVPFVVGTKAKDRPTLKVSEVSGNVYVKGGREFCVTSVEEAIKLSMVGRKNLQMAATKLNYNSSRSHCIYSIRLLKQYTGADGSDARHISRLSFCDVAGSGRTSKIEGGGDHVKETGSINASLLTLGRCLRILRHNQSNRGRPEVIPYRESKLTRIFQDYLSGRAKACMVVNINLCASCFDETLHALRFSAVAKEVVIIKEAVSLQQAAFARAPPPKFSLLLNEFRDNKRTIEWSDSEKTSSDIAVVVKDSLGSALPDEDETGGEDILDKTSEEYNEAIEKYRHIVDQLKKQLIAEKQRNVLMEGEIRQEVCEEYGKLLRDQEKDYKEEAVANAEHLAETRLELYVKSVKKRRRTEGRITMEAEDSDQDEDDAYVPFETFQAKANECEELRQELQRLKTESQQSLEEAGKKFEEQEARIQQLENENERLELAGKKSEDQEARIKRQEERIQQLENENERLELAGKKFEDQEARIKRQEERIQQLENENERLELDVAFLMRYVNSEKKNQLSSCCFWKCKTAN